MKTYLTLFILFVITIQSAFSRQADGYFINQKNDTIKATFILRKSMQEYQYGIPYLDSAGKRHGLTARDAKEIYWIDKDDTIRMLSRNIPYKFIQPGRLGNANLFLQIIADGRIKVFKLYKSNMLATTATGVATGRMFVIPDDRNYYFQVDDKDILNFKDFTTNLQSLLRDCPAVEAELSNKQYTHQTLGPIVWKFNTTCGK